MNPTNLKYTKEHEWLKFEGSKATIGITNYAQHAMGDVVFVELPQVGDVIESGKAFGVIESVKAVSEIYAPVNGTVIAVNEVLLDNPEMVNNDAYGDGWMIEIELTNLAETEGLLDSGEYEAHLIELAEEEA